MDDVLEALFGRIIPILIIYLFFIITFHFPIISLEILLSATC